MSLKCSYLLDLVASFTEFRSLILLCFIFLTAMKADRISNLLLNGMTLQKVHSRLYFPIKLVNATMQTKAVSTQVGKIAELCAVAIPSSLEVLMMRNKNNILLNTYAVQVRMNCHCHLFTYLVETAVPPKLDDHLGFFPPGRYNIFHKKKMVPVPKLLCNRSK